MPDWAALNRELKRKHVTLQILWDEYIETNPDGHRYGRFCDLYRGWEARLPVTIRQTHLGGDKLFVDYADDTVPVIVDARTGRTQGAHIFMAAMGGSSLSFAHASWTETLPYWIDNHAQTFAYFGGAARLQVPENPKVAVVVKQPSIGIGPSPAGQRAAVAEEWPASTPCSVTRGLSKQRQAAYVAAQSRHAAGSGCLDADDI